MAAAVGTAPGANGPDDAMPPVSAATPAPLDVARAAAAVASETEAVEYSSPSSQEVESVTDDASDTKATTEGDEAADTELTGANGGAVETTPVLITGSTTRRSPFAPGSIRGIGLGGGDERTTPPVGAGDDETEVAAVAGETEAAVTAWCEAGVGTIWRCRIETPPGTRAMRRRSSTTVTRSRWRFSAAATRAISALVRASAAAT